MTIFGQTDGLVVGQPLNPNFGAVNGAAAPTAGLIQQPTSAPGSGMQATGVQMTLLEAVSRGIIPRNALVTSVAAVSCGAQNATPIDDLMGNGAGAQLNLGVPLPGVSNNPTATASAGINNQGYVDPAGQPTYDTETLTSAPVSGGTTTANVTLQSGGFQG